MIFNDKMGSEYVLVILSLSDQTLDICKVVEKPENVELIDMLEAGPSNIIHKPKSLESCDPSSKKKCNLR